MNESSGDLETNEYLSKYPQNEQSIVIRKLVKIGIRYINKITHTYHPFSIKELDTLINNLALPRPKTQETLPQKKYTPKILSHCIDIIKRLLADNQPPNHGLENKIEEILKRPRTTHIRQMKEYDLFKKRFNPNATTIQVNRRREANQIMQFDNKSVDICQSSQQKKDLKNSSSNQSEPDRTIPQIIKKDEQVRLSYQNVTMEEKKPDINLEYIKKEKKKPIHSKIQQNPFSLHFKDHILGKRILKNNQELIQLRKPHMKKDEIKKNKVCITLYDAFRAKLNLEKTEEKYQQNLTDPNSTSSSNSFRQSNRISNEFVGCYHFHYCSNRGHWND